MAQSLRMTQKWWMWRGIRWGPWSSWFWLPTSEIPNYSYFYSTFGHHHQKHLTVLHNLLFLFYPISCHVFVLILYSWLHVVLTMGLTLPWVCEFHITDHTVVLASLLALLATKYTPVQYMQLPTLRILEVDSTFTWLSMTQFICIRVVRCCWHPHVP